MLWSWREGDLTFVKIMEEVEFLPEDITCCCGLRFVPLFRVLRGGAPKIVL
jgi:hypothetical protein